MVAYLEITIHTKHLSILQGQHLGALFSFTHSAATCSVPCCLGTPFTRTFLGIRDASHSAIQHPTDALTLYRDTLAHSSLMM